MTNNNPLYSMTCAELLTAACDARPDSAEYHAAIAEYNFRKTAPAVR